MISMTGQFQGAGAPGSDARDVPGRGRQNGRYRARRGRLADEPVQFLIGDLEWLAMPPILLLQFRLFYHEGKPAAVVLYAFVSEQVERRLEAGAPSLRPADWKSGERAWIVQVIAPFGQVVMLRQGDVRDRPRGP